MNIKYVKTLLLAAVCSSGVLMGEDALQKSVNTTLDAFSVDKQKQEATAKSFISQGNDLFMAGSYKDAARQYAQAAYIFDSLKDNSEHFREKAGKTREMIAKCYYYLAQETALKAHEEANASGLENAIALCKEAITIYPASAEEMNQRIAIYEKMRVAAQRRSRLSEDQVVPDKDEYNYKISVLLKQAKILYYTGQYEQARKRYQEVLLIDKLSPEAIQGARAADM
jgi:tetratricopeptide (TPR) repeat protein